jgi:hypothetical protein
MSLGARYAQAKQAMAKGEVPEFENAKEAIGFLRSEGYDIAHGSVDEIIGAQWKGFYQSDSMDREVENRMRDMRQEVLRSLPREQIVQWASEDREGLRDRIDGWAQQELDKRRPEIEGQIEKEFYTNWRKRYGDEVVIKDQDTLSSMAAGVIEAHAKGDIGPDAIFVFRGPTNEKEQWSLGMHDNGVITMLDGGHVKLGIMDRFGQYSQKGYYKTKSITEPIHNVSEIYKRVTAGVATHEYGHNLSMRDRSMEDRAAEVFRAHGGDVRHVLSEYANTNEAEATAEAYALSRHPDFGQLPKETQRVVNYIVTGERTP